MAVTLIGRCLVPKSCKVKSVRSRARVSKSPRQQQLYIVGRYKSWKPAHNVLLRFYSVKHRRHHKNIRQYLGKLRTDFHKHGGVVRAPRKVNRRTYSEVRKHKDVRVQMMVPGTGRACTRYLSKDLTVPKRVKGSLVLFQTDSVFTPGWKGN